MQGGGSLTFRVFYTRDLRRKKKVYSDGILLCRHRKTVLYSEEGETISSSNTTTKPQLQEEYTLNYSFLVVIDKTLPIEEFTTGRVFRQSPTPPPSARKVRKKGLTKIELDIGFQGQGGLQIERFVSDKLRPHQLEGVQFMWDCLTGRRGASIEGCILADFMGLGKTLQTITLIRCLSIQQLVSKVVVACPLTLLSVWQRECARWMGSKLAPLVSYGDCNAVSKAVRMFVDCDYRMLVVSYEQLGRYFKDLSSRCDMLVLDEGHRLKNKKGKLVQKILNLNCKKRVLLTGTPLQNNLEELYTCISVVNPNILGSESVFRNVFQRPILAGMSKGASSQQRNLARDRTNELTSMIKAFSLRRRADVLKSFLPTRSEYQVFFKLSPYQLRCYDTLLKSTKQSPLQYLNQMRKIFFHPLLEEERLQHLRKKWGGEMEGEGGQCPKLKFVLSLVTNSVEQGEKVVVVSYFTETLDMVAQQLRLAKVCFAQLDGRVEAHQRRRAVDTFARHIPVLLLSGKAGGTGLTLTSATNMVLIEPDWNPSNDAQVMGRIWRQGQTKPVRIFRLLVACSFEQRVLQRQHLKQALSEKLIDEQQGSSNYDFLDMRQLLIKHFAKCLTHAADENRVEDCEREMRWGNWNEVVHVQVSLSTEHSLSTTSNNQFQNLDFEKGEEEGKETGVEESGEDLTESKQCCLQPSEDSNEDSGPKSRSNQTKQSSQEQSTTLLFVPSKNKKQPKKQAQYDGEQGEGEKRRPLLQKDMPSVLAKFRKQLHPLTKL